MSEKIENLVVQTVVKIRKIVSEISDEKQKISDFRSKVFDGLEEAGKMIATQKDLADIWIKEKQEIKANTTQISELTNQLFEKLKNKDATELSSFWKQGKNYADTIGVKFEEMKKMGEVIFISEDLDRWREIWKKICQNTEQLFDIAETIHLKLSLIEKLEPEEIDELTKDIVKHIPLDYSAEEAGQYEKEYMQAYNELKEEASKKKNLWDKFMDILAGGIQETPAHRVMLRRWMEGSSE